MSKMCLKLRAPTYFGVQSEKKIQLIINEWWNNKNKNNSSYFEVFDYRQKKWYLFNDRNQTDQNNCFIATSNNGPNTQYFPKNFADQIICSSLAERNIIIGNSLNLF